MDDTWSTVVTCEQQHQNRLKEVHFVGAEFWCPDCGVEMDIPDIDPFTLDKKEVEAMDPPATCETASCGRTPQFKTIAVVQAPNPSSGKRIQVVERYRCKPCRNAIEELLSLPIAVFESMDIDAFLAPRD